MVIVLDADTKPFKFDNIKVNVIDGRNNTVRTFSEGRTSDFGIFGGNFTLSSHPSIGRWRILVQIDDAKVKISKSFMVSDESRNFIEVVTYAPHIVSAFDEEITLRISTKDLSGKLVNGEATVTANILNERNQQIRSKVKQLTLDGSRNLLIFNFRNDLGLQRIIQDYKIKFTTSVKVLGQTYKSEKEVKLVSGGKHYAVIEGPGSFKPGFNYTFQAKVYRLDGKPENDQMMQVVVQALLSKNPDRYFDDSVVLRNGMVSFVIPTRADTREMVLEVEIPNFKSEKTIPAMDRNVKSLDVTTKTEK